MIEELLSKFNLPMQGTLEVVRKLEDVKHHVTDYQVCFFKETVGIFILNNHIA
jgi:hypothetical protein